MYVSMNKYIIYKGSGGLFHNLGGLSYAINIAKKQKRILIIDAYSHLNKCINFNDYFTINEDNLEYYCNYDILPKNLTYKGLKYNEIIHLTADNIIGGDYWYKNINLSVIDNESDSIVMMCKYHKRFNTNIKINNTILQKLENETIINKPYLSIHFRNTDMKHDINKFIKKIKKLSKYNNVYSLFLASDDYSAYKSIKDKLPHINIIRKSIPPINLNDDWSYAAEDKETQLYECLRDIYFILNSNYFIPSVKSSVSKSIITMIEQNNTIISNFKPHIEIHYA